MQDQGRLRTPIAGPDPFPDTSPAGQARSGGEACGESCAQYLCLHAPRLRGALDSKESNSATGLSAKIVGEDRVNGANAARNAAVTEDPPTCACLDEGIAQPNQRRPKWTALELEVQGRPWATVSWEGSKNTGGREPKHHRPDHAIAEFGGGRDAASGHETLPHPGQVVDGLHNVDEGSVAKTAADLSRRTGVVAGFTGTVRSVTRIASQQGGTARGRTGGTPASTLRAAVVDRAFPYPT
jgi:hypothetical protein